jgi:hypothetical protein
MSIAAKLLVLAGLAVGAMLTAATAQAQSQETQVQMGDGKLSLGRLTEIRATVEAVDLAQRKVQLKGPRGKVVPLTVGEEVKNLAQVEVGDEVAVQYYQSLALSLAGADASMSLSEKSEAVGVEPGEKPGRAELRQVTVVAKVDAIDTAASTVTLRGPRGNAVDVEVPSEALQKVKVGDLVKAVYSEALAVSVSKVVVK